MKIEPSTDHDVIKSLCGEENPPPLDLWVGREGLTILVATEEDGPKMMALVYDKGVATDEPEVHLQAPGFYRNALAACQGFKDWIVKNRPWACIWSYTVDDRTFEFAKHLGFKHAFTEEGRNYIVLDLKN